MTVKHNIANDGRHIEVIIESTTCKKHGADRGEACYTIRPSSSRLGDILLSVCGPRIKRAGYTGEISPVALTLSTPGGRRSGGRKN